MRSVETPSGSEKVKVPTLSHKTRQGWGTLKVLIAFGGLQFTDIP